MAAATEKESEDATWKFAINHMTVITTKTRIRPQESKNFLLRNWESIVQDNARLLILGGNHGTKSGRLGQYSRSGDEKLREHIKTIRRRKERDMAKRNISSVLLCCRLFGHRNMVFPSANN